MQKVRAETQESSTGGGVVEVIFDEFQLSAISNLNVAKNHISPMENIESSVDFFSQI